MTLTIVPLMAAALAAVAACQPSLEGKDHCRTDDDCAVGRVCVTATCSAAKAGNAEAMPLLFIAAHGDDLIFFMNPDVEAALRAGKPSRTVVVSSGDAAGDAAETHAIESRTLAAFATMAGRKTLSGNWMCDARPYAGKATFSCRYASAPSIEVTFLRLQASSWPESIQLPALWGRDVGNKYSYGPVAELAQVIEGGDVYSRTELIAVLAAIIEESQPSYVGIPDPTSTYGEDDPDNTAAGRFAMEAAHWANASTTLHVYRGYNVYIDWEDPAPAPEGRNLTQAEHDSKAHLLDIYYDGIDLTEEVAWDEWCWRRYTIGEVQPVTGALRGTGGCLYAPALEGGMPTLGECSPNAPAWELRADHSIGAPGGGCLTVADDERSLTVNACVATPNQKWTLLENGQLHGMNGGCLSMAADGATVTTEICGSDHSGSRFGVPAGQRWTVGQGPPATP